MSRFIALSMVLFAPLALAAGGGGDDGPPSTYLELSPAFVVNVDSSGQGTGYAKAEVTLRFHKAAAREKAEAHVPWLRHEVVMLMSGRPAEELRTSAGQKELREAIRKAVSERMMAEVPSLAENQEDQEENEEQEENEGEGNPDEGEQASTPSGPIQEVLLPNFIVQAR